MSIVLDQLTKRYGGLVVVDRVSVDIGDRELFVLLGTSGSGKSTILRLIAGLASPDSGRIVLHRRDVTGLPPQKRGTGFVFQNYSIFRHMSVAENIEFGLKIRKTATAERIQKRDELLELVGMGGLGARYADQLSGGQQQRVALARALAYEPNVLLLDEPFGALDVKTRGQLRRSLKEVQRKLGVTAILVTHDQDEAFELADRIGVLDRGKLLEVGRAEELYARPKSRFAATFLGAGIVLVGKADGENARFGPLMLPIPATVSHEGGAPVQVLVRPEQITLYVEEPRDKSTLLGRGAIVEQNFSGSFRKVRLELPRLPGTRQLSPILPFGGDTMSVEAFLPSETPVASDEFWVTMRGYHILEQPEPRLLVFQQETDSRAALAMAKVMSGQMDASLTILSVADDGEEVDSRRASLLSLQREYGIAQADLRVRVGNEVEQILQEQNEALYSVVLLAARKRARFIRSGRPTEDLQSSRLSRLGPTVMRLVEVSGAPVLVVKKDRPQLKRVLICTAVGEPGKNDVRVGGWLARRLSASVTLLHVARESQEPSRLVRNHLELAAATLGSLDIEVNIAMRVASHPARAILATSRDGDYDVVIVGSHGPQSRSIFGRDDVTLQVLAGSDRPVLVVPGEQS